MRVLNTVVIRTIRVFFHDILHIHYKLHGRIKRLALCKKLMWNYSGIQVAKHNNAAQNCSHQ